MAEQYGCKFEYYQDSGYLYFEKTVESPEEPRSAIGTITAKAIYEAVAGFKEELRACEPPIEAADDQIKVMTKYGKINLRYQETHMDFVSGPPNFSNDSVPATV